MALTLAFGLLLTIATIPNLELIDIYTQSNQTLLWKIGAILGFLGALHSTMNLHTLIFTILIALLFGVNSAMLLYYVNRTGVLGVTSGKTLIGKILGLVAGILGVGCASCGALLLTPLLGTAGVAFLSTYLPFAGAEFVLLGVLILLWSASSIIKKIDNPYV